MVVDPGVGAIALIAAPPIIKIHPSDDFGFKG
jgi:hypothetical protein